MSKQENQEVQTLTRGELVRKLAHDLIDFGDDGVIMEIAEVLGYKVKKRNHQHWTIYE